MIRFPRAALAITLAIVLVGCGNESKPDAGSNSSTPSDVGEGDGGDQFADLQRVEVPSPCPEVPGMTDTEIRVGAILPQSGERARSFAASLAGIQARFDKANQTGELGTRKLVLRALDDASDATRNGEVARQLVESENVFGIIEVSDQADGSASYLAEKEIPVTGWHVGLAAWSINPNMFTFKEPPAADPNREFSTRNAKVLKELGATKVAVVGINTQASATFLDQLDKTIKADPDLESVYSTTEVTSAQTDFTAIAQRIESAGADAIYTGMDFLQNAALSEQLSRDGVTMKVTAFPGGYDPRVVSLPGIEGAVFGLEFKPLELKTNSAQDFDQYLTPDEARGQVPYVGWLSAEIFIEGLKQAGVECPTREAFITNLRLVDDYTADGAFDPVDLSASFGHQFQCVYYVRVENQAFVPLFDGKKFCGEPFFF